MIRRRIGILGGTFDPVHFGHLRTALELLETLSMDRMLLIPSGVPPHRKMPAATPRQRLDMLHLALSNDSSLQLDARECRKPGISYSVDTLRELRHRWGEDTALDFCVGTDAFLQMNTWHCWEQLVGLCNIVVVSRPGWHLPDELGPMEVWRDRFTQDSDTLLRQPAGAVLFVTLTPVDVSATRIRRLVSEGRSARYLLPEAAWQYIQQHRLYRTDTQEISPNP